MPETLNPQHQNKPVSKSAKNIALEYAEAIIVAVVLALFIRTFVVQAFKIPSESMLNTLLVGDYLLVNKFIYGTKIPFTDKYLWHLKEPRRGEVIVFEYPLDKSRDFIKRCVAVAGDTLEVRNNEVFVNGKPTYEDYKTIMGPPPPFATFGPTIVPAGHLFMMGDNRNNSSDSRYWGFLDKNLVRGRAMVIYFSKEPAVGFTEIVIEFFKKIRWDRIGAGIY